jgi:hypothetical protein
MDQATARAADWGVTLAWGMVAFGGLEIFRGALMGDLWLIFIGLFLRFAAMSEYQGTIIGHLLQHPGRKHHDARSCDPESGHAGSRRRRAILPEARLRGISDGRRRPRDRHAVAAQKGHRPIRRFVICHDYRIF